MTRNPKDSPWYVTRNDKRKRRMIAITLSPDALARLELLAERDGESKSAVIEALILEAP